ncbi:GNAT family N-acetyltransferase [Oleidesulfovibrio sp.]|uniref:GNAT family N-acetyltransferase n=1 Tax=Oleidesulfovibrio sp. TaxID=2909707 RepID=UPI003A8773AA
MKVRLRRAFMEERSKVYEWLCLSDTAPLHMGLPDYPENPVPSWEDFQQDFFDGMFVTKMAPPDMVVLGKTAMSGFNGCAQEMNSPYVCTADSVWIIEAGQQEAGCVCANSFHLLPACAELDIWMRSKAFCGRGLGAKALGLLVEYLRNECGIRRMLIRPSEKNYRAIRAYEKTGFRRVDNKEDTVRSFLLPEFWQQYGDGDYGLESTAVLVLD